MFPEGQFRKLENSVVHGGAIRKGIGRIAVLANVPVLPVVVINSQAYLKFPAWLPLRRTRYGLKFGEALEIDKSLDAEQAAEDLERRLCESLRGLYADLSVAMERKNG